jgi:hypothetical protein
MQSGCAVVEGDARFLVAAVGKNSEWGKILSELDTDRPDTPLQVAPHASASAGPPASEAARRRAWRQTAVTLQMQGYLRAAGNVRAAGEVRDAVGGGAAATRQVELVLSEEQVARGSACSRGITCSRGRA